MKYITESLAQALYERRTNEGADWSGYKVRYTYQGDSLSDYESTCIVKAKDEKSAIKIAMQNVNADAARNFRIDGTIDSYFAYKKNYPHSNLKVFEGSINEETTQDYINTLEFVLKKFTSIDDDKLKKALDKAIEDVKSGNRSNLDTRHIGSSTLTGLYNYYTSAVRDINIMIGILKGNKSFKRTWIPESPLYDIGTLYLRRSNASKEWKDCMEIIRKAMEACKEYHDIYWDHGNYSGIIKEVQSVIKSGGLYQETLKDLSEICKAATGGCLQIKDGAGSTMSVDIGYSQNVNTVRSQITKYMVANKDKYPELELKDVFRSSSDDCVKARFKVALEKIPKTDVQVGNTKTTISAQDQSSSDVTSQPSGKYNNFKVPNRDIQKMTEYFNKGSNPKTLANTVKDVVKALARYYIAVSTGWKECEDSFYNRCKELGVSEADLKQIHDKAASDKGIDIGSVQAVKTTTSSSSTVSNKPERKVISATDDTGFVPASGVPFESAIEVNESNENGAVISRCIKGLSDKDIKNILSYVKGDVQGKNTINLNDKVFKGLVVDIVRADTRNPVTSYDIEIKSNKNNPWNREWTPILKKSGAPKYTNGWMLTGYKSKSDADKDYERIQYNLKNMKFDDDDDWG